MFLTKYFSKLKSVKTKIIRSKNRHCILIKYDVRGSYFLANGQIGQLVKQNVIILSKHDIRSEFIKYAVSGSIIDVMNQLATVKRNLVLW